MVSGVVLIGGITTLIICLKRAKNKNKIKPNDNEEKIEGNDKVIKYENTPVTALTKEIINK